MEQVFFNIPLSKLEPIFKKWVKDVLNENSSFHKESNRSRKDFFTVEETAEFLNLKIPTIYSKVSRGELPYMKQGKRLYFSSDDLIQYLRKGRRLTNDELYEEASTYLKKKGGSRV